MNKREFKKLAADVISKSIDEDIDSGRPVDQVLVESAIKTMFAFELARALFDNSEDELTIER